MKRFGRVLALIFALLPCVAAPVSAQAVAVSQEIHIRGVVPPMRFIVVDGHGDIMEVTSNTPDNVTPVVRLNSIAHGATVPLTTNLRDAYRQKTAGHDMHSLDLHFALPNPELAKRQTPTLLAKYLHISFMQLVLAV
ncbi:MAG TPA: hypothetical protein VFN56_00480 [Candidatus Saccharimonadales bacterium]|nr:hypothetical protein [Candidatus Saccharimonadales bacterium]